MDANHKKILKAIVLELRHMLEGHYIGSVWHAGDIEQRLNALGVWRDRNPLSADELVSTSTADREARRVVDAYLKLRDEAGVKREEAVAEFVRETAYTWANRLLALRCMESRELIDEVILQKQVYGGRSLEHNRLAQRRPELCTGDDDGLFAALNAAFVTHARHLPLLFDPKAPGIALRPGVAALKRAVALLSGIEAVRGQDPATSEVFRASDVLGWAYQYYQLEEKQRVDDWLKTKKGFKCEGADIAPKTALYTEQYMVEFLVQNSLGALWLAMRPDTRLGTNWQYLARDLEPVHIDLKPVRDITLLDPACGSGHFLLEAFQLFYEMYMEEGEITDSQSICESILQRNLFGVDIDERAVQISEAALWMKASETVLRAAGSTCFDSVAENLVATNIKLPKGVNHLDSFLSQHPEDKPLSAALDIVFNGLSQVDELGSLVRIEAPVEAKLKELQQSLQLSSSIQTNLYEPTYVQGQLPIGVDSFESWKREVVLRLKTHFHKFGDVADPVSGFFGRSAERGLLLFENLARRHDVVLTNPPYLHCSNFGPAMRDFIYAQYSSTSQDLYAAFMARCVELTRPESFCGIVSQQSFMFLERHAGLREYLYDNTSPVVAGHLGSGAFSEIGGEVVNVILLVFRHTPSMDALGTFYDLTNAQEKELSLRGVVKEASGPRVWKRSWNHCLKVPGSPIVYSLTDDVLAKFTGGLLEHSAVVPAGMVTGENNRFVRFWWETSGTQWQPYMKGGEAIPWFGSSVFVVDASSAGFIRMSSAPTFRAAGREFYGRAGITYSAVSTTITARLVEPGALWDCGGPMIIPNIEHDIYWILGCVNSAFASRLLHKLNPTINIKTNDVKRVPTLPESPTRDRIHQMSHFAVQLARSLESRNAIFAEYDDEALLNSDSLSALANQQIQETELLECALTVVQDAIDQCINAAFSFDAASAAEFRRPYASYPPLFGYADRLPIANVPPDLSGLLCVPDAEAHITDSQIERARQIYEASSSVHEEHEVSSDDEAVIEGDGFEDRNVFENIARDTGIHVVSAYWLVRRYSEQHGWSNAQKTRLVVERLLTRCTLHAIGYHWRHQQHTTENPVQAIVPITDSVTTSLLTRVRKDIEKCLGAAEVEAIEAEFGEVMGLSLGDWLDAEFFKRHVTDFRKRPIAWQIQSHDSRVRRKPAFSGLLPYRQMSPGTLQTLQSQFVRPQRQRYETEMRGIESIPQNARSDRQQERLSELMELISELRRFDERLEDVSRSGFGPDKVWPQLRQYAIDDATLCLKARWLQRLSDDIVAGPLTNWRDKASKAKLHADLPSWIQNAMSTLQHQCSLAGPSAPKQELLHDDPTSTSLASLICKKADEMVSTGMALACSCWWKPLAEAVFAPLRANIKEAKDELKQLKEEDYSKADHPFHRRKEIDARTKDLKENCKLWDRELKEKTAAAERLRKDMLAWSCPEARSWENWLASQPMYDAISGLDGVRHPPRSIADWVAQESAYAPDINDGVRVNIAPLQKAGLLAADVLAAKDLDKAIADRADWRADERRWCREGKLPQPGWRPMEKTNASAQN